MKTLLNPRRVTVIAAAVATLIWLGFVVKGPTFAQVTTASPPAATRWGYAQLMSFVVDSKIGFSYYDGTEKTGESWAALYLAMTGKKLDSGKNPEIDIYEYLGKNGWELVAVQDSVENRSIYIGKHIIYFKKLLPS